MLPLRTITVLQEKQPESSAPQLQLSEATPGPKLETMNRRPTRYVTMSKGNARNALRSFVEKSWSLAMPYPNSKNWLQSQELDEKNMLYKLSIIYLCGVVHLLGLDSEHQIHEGLRADEGVHE